MAASQGDDEIEGPLYPEVHEGAAGGNPSHSEISSLDNVNNSKTELPMPETELQSSASAHSNPRVSDNREGNLITEMQRLKLDKYEGLKVNKPKLPGSVQTPLFNPKEKCSKKNLKITEIHQNVYREVCKLLNIPRVLGGDVQSLAGELDYSVTDIKAFMREKNPTDALFTEWSVGKDNIAEKILNILVQMDRDDVVQLLEAELERLCRDCNCEMCGSLV